MLPPIPAPPPIKPIEKGPRPPALKFFIAISLLSTVLWLILPHDLDAEEMEWWWPTLYWTAYFIWNIAWLTILWFLWQGHNWARIVTMILCAISPVSLFFINDYEGPYGLVQKGLCVFDVLFSLAWFVSLRSLPMLSFTKEEPA